MFDLSFLPELQILTSSPNRIQPLLVKTAIDAWPVAKALSMSLYASKRLLIRGVHDQETFDNVLHESISTVIAHAPPFPPVTSHCATKPCYSAAVAMVKYLFSFGDPSLALRLFGDIAPRFQPGIVDNVAEWFEHWLKPFVFEIRAMLEPPKCLLAEQPFRSCIVTHTKLLLTKMERDSEPFSTIQFADIACDRHPQCDMCKQIQCFLLDWTRTKLELPSAGKKSRKHLNSVLLKYAEYKLVTSTMNLTKPAGDSVCLPHTTQFGAGSDYLHSLLRLSNPQPSSAQIGNKSCQVSLMALRGMNSDSSTVPSWTRFSAPSTALLKMPGYRLIQCPWMFPHCRVFIPWLRSRLCRARSRLHPHPCPRRAALFPASQVILHPARVRVGLPARRSFQSRIVHVRRCLRVLPPRPSLQRRRLPSHNACMLFPFRSDRFPKTTMRLPRTAPLKSRSPPVELELAPHRTSSCTSSIRDAFRLRLGLRPVPPPLRCQIYCLCGCMQAHPIAGPNILIHLGVPCHFISFPSQLALSRRTCFRIILNQDRSI
jgi:hypothetical protein